METGFRFFSGSADKVLIPPVLTICALLLFLTTILMLWLALQRNDSQRSDPKNITANISAEIALIIIPALLVLGMFYYGWNGYPRHYNSAGREDSIAVPGEAESIPDSRTRTANDSLPSYADIHKKIPPGAFLKRNVPSYSGLKMTGPDIYFPQYYLNYGHIPDFRMRCLPE